MPPNPPSSPFSKGEKEESFTTDPAKALLPWKKGGREGFPGRPFENAKVLLNGYILSIGRSGASTRFYAGLRDQTKRKEQPVRAALKKS
jgi:hypothetical protein